MAKSTAVGLDESQSVNLSGNTVEVCKFDPPKATPEPLSVTVKALPINGLEASRGSRASKWIHASIVEELGTYAV